MTDTSLVVAASTAMMMLVAMGMYTGMLLIAVLFVRKRRPECWIWFAIAAGVNLFWFPSSMALRFGLPFLFGIAGPQLALVGSVITVLNAIVDGATTACVLVGIVKLARPALSPSASS